MLVMKQMADLRNLPYKIWENEKYLWFPDQVLFWVVNDLTLVGLYQIHQVIDVLSFARQEESLHESFKERRRLILDLRIEPLFIALWTLK